MNNWNGSLWFLTLIVLLLSCDRTGDGKDVPDPKRAAQDTRASFVLFSPDGDTLPTGVPIPARGIKIDPDSVAKPIKMPLATPPKIIKAPNSTFADIRPTEVGMPKDLQSIIPGKNGVPMPDTVMMKKAILPMTLHSAAATLPPSYKDRATHDISFLDVEHGLLASTIHTILVDSRGFIWYGTMEGLGRYDGHNFSYYTNEQWPNGYFVRHVFEDSKKNLWIITEYGLIWYDGNEFIHLADRLLFSGREEEPIFEDNDENLWIGTNNGVIRWDGKSFLRFDSQHGLPGDFIESISADDQGNLWFGTDNGACRYTPDASGENGSFTPFTMREGFLSTAVYSIEQDQWGDIWFATMEGFSIYDGSRFLHYKHLAENPIGQVQVIFEDRQGHIWLGALRTLIRFDGQEFFLLKDEQGLNGSTGLINTIAEDDQGRLWIGSWDGGLQQYNHQGFNRYFEEQGLSQNRVSTIYEDKKGNLWFGTWDRGVTKYDGENFTQYSGGLFDQIIYTIGEDWRGNLFFGTINNTTGLFHFDGNNLTQYTTKQGLASGSVSRVLKDSLNRFWIATYFGINRFDPDPDYPQELGNLWSYSLDGRGSHNMVYGIFEDSHGDIWFGSRACLSRFDPDAYNGRGSFTHFKLSGEQSDATIRSIFGDKSGNLWLGTYRNGLFQCDLEKLRHGELQYIHYQVEDGLKHNYISSIIGDQEDRIWVAGPKGIAVLVPPKVDEDSLVENDQFKYPIFSFGLQDGVPENEFYLGSVYRDRNNRIWWGSTDGVVMLDLNKFELPSQPPKIYLDRIELQQQFVDYRRLADTAYRHTLSFGKPLSQLVDSVAPYHNYPVGITFPHHLNHLSFQFSGIDWAAPHKVKYSYYLEGFDEGWSRPATENRADYRNLPAGTYTFKVKAIGSAQVWSETFEYSFTVRPPWWQSWWAYTLYGLVTVALLIALYRFLLNRQLELAETHRLRELDQVKTKLYTNISHEFRTPLTVIMGMTGEIEKPEPKNLIRRNSRYLLNLVNQMLDLSKLESGGLKVKMIQGDVCAYLRYLLESFHSYAESKEIALYFKSEPPELVMDYDPDKLLQIVSNLLSNAIKFTPEGGEVHLTVSGDRETVDDQCLTINVKDSGIGIPADQLPHIFDRFYQVDDSTTRRGEGTGIGLTLTQELVRLLGGEIGFDSQEGKGTTFSVTLPVRREAPTVETIFPSTTVIGSPDKAAMTSATPKVVNNNSPLVLIIEDNQDVQRYLQNSLAGAYRVETAFDGQAGEDKALELTPDIIISDVMMPGQDGFALTRKLKTDPRTSHIPIILLTAKADMESRLEGLERGADAYLAKPFEREELLLRMRKLLELRRRLRQYYLSLAGSSVPEPAPEEAGEEHLTEPAFVWQVRSLVEKNLLDSDYSVDQLCKDLAMSRSQLHRKLTALTGYSANRFARYIRLSKARRLLEDTGKTVAEIAYDTGFTDPGYFTRAFRKEFGVTPTGFREKV